MKTLNNVLLALTITLSAFCSSAIAENSPYKSNLGETPESFDVDSLKGQWKQINKSDVLKSIRGSLPAFISFEQPNADALAARKAIAKKSSSRSDMGAYYDLEKIAKRAMVNLMFVNYANKNYAEPIKERKMPNIFKQKDAYFENNSNLLIALNTYNNKGIESGRNAFALYNNATPTTMLIDSNKGWAKALEKAEKKHNFKLVDVSDFFFIDSYGDLYGFDYINADNFIIYDIKGGSHAEFERAKKQHTQLTYNELFAK